MQASERAAAAGDRATAAIALADAACLAGRCPATFAVAPPHDGIVPLVRRAQSLAPAADQEVALHVALAAAWNGRPQFLEPDPELAWASLALAREVDDPEA